MSMALKTIPQRLFCDDRGIARRVASSQSCKARRQNAESDPTSTAVVASLAAVSLVCSVDATALAEVAVQGGVFESLGFDNPATVTKKGIQLQNQKLKTPFGPAPEVSKKSTPVKPSAPKPVPSVKSKKFERPVEVKKKQTVKEKPATERRKLVEEQKSIFPAAKAPSPPSKIKADKKVPSKVVTEKKSAPKITKEKKPTVKSSAVKSPGLKLPEVKAPSVQLPEVKLPAVPAVGKASSRDTTEAAVVVGLEVLLVLIASSAVGGLLKKT